MVQEWVILYYYFRFRTRMTYYYKAYAISDIGSLWRRISFATKTTIPTISTKEITEITVNSAKTGGDIYSDGGAGVISKGIVWSDIANLM